MCPAVAIVLLSLLFTIFSGVLSFQAQESVSPSTPVLGNNGFVLRCAVSVSVATGEALQGISLHRKRSADTNFVKIVSFPAPAFGLNYTLQDSSLTSRTVITQPDTSESTSASLTFSDTQCSDIAEYKWIITYYYQEEQPPIERTSDVKVQGKFLLSQLHSEFLQ